jgi:tetratricopeptide (TPR) repeat protein
MMERGWLVLALAVAVGAVGCTHQTGLPLTPDDKITAADIKKAPELPKRPPLPSTCVALARFSERSAADPKCSPADQTRLRDQARRAYQQALDLDPKNLDALTGLARLYVTMEDHGRAVATYQKATEFYPKKAVFWHELGMCHARAKEWDPAVASLRQAVELEPEEHLYVHSLGFCLARMGRHDESFQAFAKLEGEAAAHYDLARMLYHQKQDELCKLHLQQALALKPDMQPAQQLLAVVEKQAPDTTAPPAPVSFETAPGATQENEAAGKPADQH